MKRENSVYVVLSPNTIITVILSVLLVAMLWYLRELVFVVLTAVVIASAVEPAVQLLIRTGLPRVLSVVLLYLSIAFIGMAACYFFLPPLLHESKGFITSVPKYIETFQLSDGIGSSLIPGLRITNQNAILETITSLQGIFTNASSGAFQAVSVVFGGLLSFILIVVLSFYFAVQDTGIDDFLRLITPIKKHRYVLDLWRRSQHKIGRWMQGQVLLSLMAGVLVWAGLALLDVRYAFLLGVVAALLELIPVFGSILAAVPAVAIGFADGGTSLGLMVIMLYIVVNQFQAHLVYPLVVQKVVGLPPLLVILALIVGAQIAGFLGIILSVPVAAALREFISDVQKGKQKLIEEHEALQAG